MSVAPPRAEVTLKVPFHDCDPMGVVWHGNYARYFEAARVALLEQAGYSYAEQAESGYVWPIIDFSVRYLRPIRSQQCISVTATLCEWRHRLKFGYLIADAASGERLSRGHTVQVAVRAATGKMLLSSPDYLGQCLGVN